MAHTVRTITAAEHAAFNRAQPSVSFLQTPAWGAVKTDWRAESLGWFDADETLVGAGLVLYRQLPRIKRFLAYLPEGPVIDWTDEEIGDWLSPLAAHLKHEGAFGVRIGAPLVARRWHSETVKAAIADPRIGRLSQAMPDVVDHDASRLRNQLRELGWRPPPDEEGFAAGQPRFVFQLPLDGQTPADLLRGMNQLWRRNIKKAEKAGVEVRAGQRRRSAGFPPALPGDGRAGRVHSPAAQLLPDRCSPHSTARTRIGSGSTSPGTTATWWPPPPAYGWAGTSGTPTARHSTAKREARGSNATQWRMITDALAAGATVYDLRGITETVEAEDPHVGLIQFKVGTGGEAVEYVGEWDLPLNAILYAAFDLYMNGGTDEESRR